MSSPAASYRAIICVDIERFCDPDRNDPERMDMRRGLYGSLERAFTGSGIPWESYNEDRGDGAFFLIAADGPQARLVEPLPFALAAELSRHNGAADAATRIRLRVAMDAGYVSRDAQGIVGTPLNRAFRLLDAPVLRKALEEAPGDLAFIASNQFYDDVISQQRGFEPAAYREVRIAAKETDAAAWICAFDGQLHAGQECGERLPRVQEAVRSIEETLDEARRERSETVERISSAVRVISDPLPGLRERLAALDDPSPERHRERHGWSELAAEAAALEEDAAAALRGVREVLREVIEPRERRAELRGLLQSYQAMAGNQRRAEQPQLDQLYRRARELLWTRPCDLPSAEAATMRYVRAIQKEPGA